MRLFSAALDLLYPPKCPFCGRVLERGEEGVCALCRLGLPRCREPKPVAGCDTCISPLWYQDGVREGVHRYKFDGGALHAKLFGELMARCLSERWETGADLVTWVPLHRRRLARRGYDQAELLAVRVAELNGVPCKGTLEKIRNTGEQSLLRDEGERFANVSDAYRALPGVDLAGKRVVLVDDVVTTGGTMAACAACLREAGAETVAGLTLARAR